MVAVGLDLEGTLDAFQDVLYVIRLEPDPGFEFVSDAVTALVGYTPQEHYEDPGLGTRLVDPRDLAALQTLANSDLDTPVEAQVRWLAKDGRVVWTHHRCIKRRRPDGSLVLVGSARDVSEHMTAMQEAADAREEFRLLAENAADLVCRLSGEGSPEWVSPSVHRLLGYEPHGFLSMTWDDLVHPDERPVLSAALADLAQTGSYVRSLELRLRHRDGRFVWWHATARRIDDHATRSRIVVALRNIDSEVLAREAADEEMQRRASAVASMLDPYILVKAVRDSRGQVYDFSILDANEAAAVALGADISSLVGAKIGMRMPQLAESEVFAAAVRTLHSGEALRRDDLALAGGGRIDLRATRLNEDSLSVTWRDVTQRHRILTALAESEARYRLLVENTADVVWVVGVDGRIRWVSASCAAALGYETNELSGSHLRSLCHPDDVEALDQAITAAAKSESPVVVTVRLHHRGGEYRWMEAAASRMPTEQADQAVAVRTRDIDEQVRAQEELSRRDAELRLVVENVGDVVFHSVDGVLLWVSPSIERLTGWQRDELIGTRTAHLWHPDDRDVAIQLREGVYAGMPARGVLRLQRKDGEYEWVEASLRPHYEPDGRIGAVGSLRDVEAQVAAQDALRRSEALYRLLAENASDIVVLTDAHGRCRWVSPSMEKILGWSPSALIDQPLVDLVHPEDRTATAEMRYRTAADSWRWMSAVTHVVGGSEAQTVTSLRDVTQLVESRTALLASERQYRLLADHSGDVVVAVDNDGVLTYVSPAVVSVLGWRPDEVVGTAVHDLMHSQDAALWLKQGRGTPLTARIRLRCSDGSYRWISSVGQQILGDAGPDGAVATWRDVHAEVEAEQALHQERARLQAVLNSELEPHVYLEAIRDATDVIVDFVYRDVNDAACEYMGMPREQLEGARVLDLLPGQAGTGMLAMYAAAVDSGRPLALDNYSYPHEILESERRYDIRAVRVGDGLSFAWRDVTRRYEADLALAASEQRFRALVEATAVGLMLTATDGRILQVNAAAAAILGLEPEEMIGESTTSQAWPVVHPDGRPVRPQEDPIQRVAATGETVAEQVLGVRSPDGGQRWLNVTAVPFSVYEAPSAVLTTFTDVTAEVEAREMLAAQARTDPLTGLLNRGEALRRLADVLCADRTSTVVLYCDLDGLKQVNDTLGHAAGDQLLVAAAQRIETVVADQGIVARMGGDEFLVLLSSTRETARDIADRMCAAVSEPVVLPGASAPLCSTISIGIAGVLAEDTEDSMIARADAQMYAAKAAGGGVWRELKVG